MTDVPPDEYPDGEYEDEIPTDDGDAVTVEDDFLDIDQDGIPDDIPADVEEPEGFDDGSRLS